VLEELKIIGFASGEVHNLGMGLGVFQGTEGQRVSERVFNEIKSSQVHFQRQLATPLQLRCTKCHDDSSAVFHVSVPTARKSACTQPADLRGTIVSLFQGLPRSGAPPQIPRMQRGLPQRRRIRDVHKVIAVSSAKGGVGKSTIAGKMGS
jgi:Mrp family chromosome partitioning ATPase